MTDIEFRLECVRAAMGFSRSEDVMAKAREIYEFAIELSDKRRKGDLPIEPSYDAKYLHG